MALEFKHINDLYKSYADHGTHAHMDITVYRPIPPDGFFVVGYYAQGNYDNPKPDTPDKNILVVKPTFALDPPALAPPKSFSLIWNDRNSGGDEDGSFWVAIPPEGYTAVGDVGIYKQNGPSTLNPDQVDNLYRCVRTDLLKHGQYTQNNIWNDHGSHADDDGSIWGINNSSDQPTGFFRAVKGYDRPNPSAHILDENNDRVELVSIIFETPTQLPTEVSTLQRQTFTNDTSVQQSHSVTFTQTNTTVSTLTFSQSESISIQVKGKAGIPFVSEGSISVTSTTTIGFGEQYADTSTTTWSQTFNVSVPPKTTSNSTLTFYKGGLTAKYTATLKFGTQTSSYSGTLHSIGDAVSAIFSVQDVPINS